MEISFYEIISENLVPSLVRLLAKVYASGQRCVFYSPNDDFVKVVDKALWTFSTKEFIPHGDAELGFENLQPIYFTSQWKNPNNAVVLVTDTFDFEKYHDMEKVLVFFEDNSEKKIETAKSLIDRLKSEKNNVNYWKQSSKGWTKI